MGTTPRSIQSVLHASAPDIADLLGRARFYARIRTVLLDALPDTAAPEVRVAAYEQGRLKLFVSNGGWATRLRYMQPALRQALARQMRLHVDTIDIRVRPDQASPPAPRRPRFVSDDARAQMQLTARYIDDRSLADALNRLAAAGRSE